ncbi:hypothetical protein BCR42DRAFT_495227 [Absidia repens]|uniref:Uncharacterized protein n=1 Tax=Absidia repens TaxID=90262 RepID=A0A1X2I448_9FUNG|nr:hypothetical protein BCR42DRAFT_495227 [Absidia repens]
MSYSLLKEHTNYQYTDSICDNPPAITAARRYSSYTFTAPSRRSTTIECSTPKMSFATLSSRRPQFYHYLSDVDPHEQSYRESFNRSTIYPFDYFNSSQYDNDHYHDDSCMIRIDSPLKASITSPTSCFASLHKIAEAITATATATTSRTATDNFVPTIDSGAVITGKKYDSPCLPKKQDGFHTYPMTSTPSPSRPAHSSEKKRSGSLHSLTTSFSFFFFFRFFTTGMRKQYQHQKKANTTSKSHREQTQQPLDTKATCTAWIRL